ncbi:unnamed protein product [Protopolystoma xenopodis]|uniref:Uncharacterized protein n=1 Tax=Protopolystoma xenopodis TaxID=117903 RepID=A0A3S5B8E3_9PLAT|nr:unnamed protein product [Protopolystoma xenopodis]
MVKKACRTSEHYVQKVSICKAYLYESRPAFLQFLIGQRYRLKLTVPTAQRGYLAISEPDPTICIGWQKPESSVPCLPAATKHHPPIPCSSRLADCIGQAARCTWHQELMATMPTIPLTQLSRYYASLPQRIELACSYLPVWFESTKGGRNGDRARLLNARIANFSAKLYLLNTTRQRLKCLDSPKRVQETDMTRLNGSHICRLVLAEAVDIVISDLVSCSIQPPGLAMSEGDSYNAKLFMVLKPPIGEYTATCRSQKMEELVVFQYLRKSICCLQKYFS